MPPISAALRDKIKKQQIENLMSYMQEHVSLYVAPSGRVADSQQASQDLFVLVQQFLANPQENNLLITGVSGVGKTFFGLTYVQRLWENYVDGQPMPLWIPLLSIDYPSQHLLHKHFQYNLHLSADEIQVIFASRIPLIIILDGYDELNTNVNLHQTNQFDTLPAGTKIMTTCRYEAMKLVSEDYRRCFISKVAGQLLSTIEILPFDSLLEEDAPIGCYIKKFLEHPPKDIELPQPRWTVKTYLDHLKRLPEIHDLISNPYILGRVIEELPGIVKESEKELSDTKRILFTRYRLYEIFTERWFKRQADKYRRAGHPASQLDGKYKDKNGKACTLEELFTNYTRRLAKAMFHRHINVIEYHPQERNKLGGSLASVRATTSDWTAKYLGDELNPDLALLRAGCPLIRLGPRRYTFLHKSLAEFFAAQHLFNGALVQAQVLSGRNLNYGNLQLEPQVLTHLIDQAKTNPGFELILWNIIDLSKSEPTVWRAAANAATIIGRAKNLIGANLRRARLGGEEGNEKWGADLSHTWMDNADAREGDLRYCNLEGASIAGLKLQGACLDGVKFGELPYLEGYNFSCSSDGKLMAIARKYGNDNHELTVYAGSLDKIIKKITLENQILRIHFSPKKQQIAVVTGGYYRTLTLLDLSEGKVQEIIPKNSRRKLELIDLIYLNNGEQLAIICLGKKIIVLFDTNRNEFYYYEQKYDYELNRHEFISCLKSKEFVDIENSNRFKTTSTYTCIASSPDGRQLALGRGDKSIVPEDDHTKEEGNFRIILWESNNPKKCMLLYGGHTNRVNDIKYHPNGIQLVSCSEDATICLWDINTGEMLQKIMGHNAAITVLAISSDGSQLASGSEDKTILLWKMPDGKLQRKLTGHVRTVVDLFYHPNDMQLVSRDNHNGNAHLWNLTNSNLPSACDTEIFYHGSCHYDGLLAAAVSFTHTIYVWEMPLRQLRFILRGHKSRVKSIACSDYLELASLSENIIYIWNLQTGLIKKEININNINMMAAIDMHLIYVPHSSKLLLNKNGSLIIYSIIEDRLSNIGEPEKYLLAAFRQDGLQMIAVKRGKEQIDCEVEVWDLIHLKLQRLISLPRVGRVTHIIYDSNGEDVLIWFSVFSMPGLFNSYDAQFLYRFSLNSTKCHEIFSTKTGFFSQISSISYSLDKFLVAAVSKRERSILIWNILESQDVLKISNFTHTHSVSWVSTVRQSEDHSSLYSLMSIDEEGVKYWQIILKNKQLNYRLVWASHLSRHLNTKGLNLSRSTGLSEMNHQLLRQRSQSTLSGEPSTASSVMVLASRNKQRYIASGKQEVKKTNGTYILNRDCWLISLVREYAVINGKKQLTDHVYLIIQGIDENDYTVIKKIDLVLKDKQLHFFEIVGSAKIRIHEKSPWDLKEEEQNLESISREIQRAQAELLIGKVHARMASAVGTGYLVTGKAPRLFNIPWQNCLSFCLEMLEEAHIPIEPQQKNWTRFFCAFPSDYISEPVVANKTTESCLIC